MSLSQPNGPEDSDLTALLDDWDNTVEPLGQGTTTFAAGPQQGIELAAQHGDLQLSEMVTLLRLWTRSICIHSYYTRALETGGKGSRFCKKTINI